MYIFGKRSRENLKTANKNIQTVLNKSIEISPIDFAVLDCHRNEYKQNKYFQEGKSKVQWPDGKHNSLPSDAADVVPIVNGKPSWNHLHCCVLAGAILATAALYHIKLRWGGNWDMDGEPITDQDFQDLAHFEEVL